MIEVGDGEVDPYPALEADISDPDRHAPLGVATRPGLGGTSRLWGGRCVPMDASDFRHQGGAPWPIRYEDLLPWWEAAADFLGAGGVVEAPAPGRFGTLAAHSAARSETWGGELDMSRRWRERIADANGPAILTGARAVGFDIDGFGAVGSLRLNFGSVARSVRAAHFVAAAGGLGTLRLLLGLDRDTPGLIKGAAMLGQGYMGHLTGSIADLIPGDPADIASFGCLPFGAQGDDGAARRRITPLAATLERERLRNIAFWLDNPPPGDPAHGSGAASAKYLLLRQARLGRRLVDEGLRAIALRGSEPALGPHLKNIAREPAATCLGLIAAARARLSDRHRRPERLTPIRGGWRMHYHAEQSADPSNRVSLSDERDAAGLRRLKIEYGFSDADIASVVAAHDVLDRDLKASGAGALRYLQDPGDRVAAVRDAARDGYHQIGGAAMSDDPATGVVDPDCRVHGLVNLWVASSAVFPRSGQANPTLTIVALARRLADRLARL